MINLLNHFSTLVNKRLGKPTRLTHTTSAKWWFYWNLYRKILPWGVFGGENPPRWPRQ